MVAGPLLTSNVFTFTLHGGISGRSYEVTINAQTTSGVRSDVLNVNVPGDDGNSWQIVQPILNNALTSPDGSLLVNTTLRFFVSATPPNGANVMDQWYNTAVGELFSNASNGAEANWIVISGGGGGGGGGGGNVNILKVDPITSNGSTTTFSLTVSGIPASISSTNNLFVSVDGVWQEPSVQYFAVGNQITFTEAPLVGSKIFMMWFVTTGGG